MRVYAPAPKKTKIITYRGWEPLGYCGSIFTIGSNDGKVNSRYTIANNRAVDGLDYYLTTDKQNKIKVDNFGGGWGTGSFNLQSLMLRVKRGICRPSDSFEGFDRFRFISCKVLLIPALSIDYLFRFNHSLAMDTHDRERQRNWIHPLMMLLTPGCKVVQSLQRNTRGKWKKAFCRRTGSISNKWQDIWKGSLNAFFSYDWSTVDLNNPFGLPDFQSSANEFHNRWLKEPQAGWANRRKWDEAFVGSSQEGKEWWRILDWTSLTTNHKPEYGPFCPPVFPSEETNAFYFFYKIKLQFGGTHEFLITNPGDYGNEVPPTPNITREDIIHVQDPTYAKYPEDYDSNGILTDAAFSRITGTSEDTRLQNPHSDIHEELQEHGGQTHSKKVKWWDKEEKRTELLNTGAELLTRIDKFLEHLG